MSDKTEQDSGKMVTAPYVTAKVRDDAGQFVTLGFYEGSVLPGDTDAEDLERLERKGMVADVGSAEARFAAPAGTPKPGEPPNVPVTEVPVSSLPLAERQARQAEASRRAGEESARPEGQPAPYAAKTAWVDYAVSRRADDVSEEDARREAEGMSKADLIRTHGGTPAADDTES